MTHGTNTPDELDDGRTVADMSDLRRPSLLHLPTRAGFGGSESAVPSRDFSEELQDSEERWMVVLGTLRAALSLWLVYVVVFGIVIAFMVACWT